MRTISEVANQEHALFKSAVRATTPTTLVMCSPREVLENPIGERDGVGHHARPRRGEHDVRGQDEQEEPVALAQEVEAAAVAQAQRQGQLVVVAPQPTLGLRGRGGGGGLQGELRDHWKPKKPGGLLGRPRSETKVESEESAISNQILQSNSSNFQTTVMK